MEGLADIFLLARAIPRLRIRSSRFSLKCRAHEVDWDWGLLTKDDVVGF